MEQTLGAAIAARRKQLGMTQLQLAEQLGVTDKAVSKWERDLSCPDVHTLPRLAEVFGLSVDELMQGLPSPQTQQEPKPVQALIPMILRAVGLAMGVAVTVLSVLGQLEPASGLGMLGIGLTCLAISAFPPKDKP